MSTGNRFAKGFTLVEVLMTVTLIAVMASVAYVVVSNVRSSAQDQKLDSDVATLNRAAASYLASGGDLFEADTPEEVLQRLRSVASSDLAFRMPGISSSVVAPRISFAVQSAEEAASGAPRAVWDPAKRRFTIAHSGPAGIREFILDDSLAEVPGDSETRTAPMLYAKSSGWIWDYQDNPNPGPNPGSTFIATAPDPGSTATPATVPPPTPPSAPPAPPGILAPPTFSSNGGKYGIALYPLALSLANPNPAGVSQIIYKVDSGGWQNYSTPINVGPGSTVNAQSVALVSTWTNSAISAQNYQADPVQLSPPIITPDLPSFGLFSSNDIIVALSNANPAGSSVMRYRINGGAWQAYSAPFALKKANFPAGANIEAESISSGSPYYLSSSISTRVLALESLNLSGTTTGAFHSPTGSSTMVTNLASGARNNFFSWGDANGTGMSKSTMNISGVPFSSVADGVRFKIGNLNYYNGTIKSGTGADTVGLDITLAITVNGKSFNPFFDFEFELINTPNNVPDPWAAADYVRLADPRASRTIAINGNEFEFKIEFGETTPNGFSNFSEFHVLEEKSAGVNLYGTFTLLGPVKDNSNPVNGGITISTVTGTGSVTDGVFQKEGYVDTTQYSKNLVEATKQARDNAQKARDNAKSGAALAATGAKDIASKISSGKYSDAAKLAAEAVSGAEAAEAAAKSAEAAAAAAKSFMNEAVALANDIQKAKALGLNPSDIKKQADEVTKLANEAVAFATEARSLANEAKTNATTASAAWSNFLSNGATSDPAGYLKYFADTAAIAASTAKSARDKAVSASSDATKAQSEIAKKISDKKYADARALAATATEAANLAEQSALAAEAAAAQANAAANQAIAIAGSTNSLKADKDKAVASAADATTYASAARSAANTAKATAAAANSQVANLPTTNSGGDDDG